MNIELMEKIAKRKEDPNYPYGNKLPLDRKGAIKAGVKGGLKGATIGGSAGGLLSAACGNEFPIKKTIVPMAASVSALGAISKSREGFKKYQEKDRDNKALSYLPSEEQRVLFEKNKALEVELNRLYKERDELKNLDSASFMSDADLDRYKEVEENINDAIWRGVKLDRDARVRGKALMLEEKKNRRLFKKASFDYDEMVKCAYEDILGGFEKSAAENDDEEAKRAEQKKKIMKRLAAAGALTAGATATGIGLYKYNHRPSRYYSETSAFRKNMRDAMKGKPVTKLRDDEWEIVTPHNAHHTILTPLLSAAN